MNIYSLFYVVYRKPVFPLFLSQVSIVLSALLFGAVNIMAMLVFAMVSFFQLFLMYEGRLRNQLIPLRFIDIGEEKLRRTDLREKVSLLLPVLVVLSGLSHVLAFIFLFFVVLIFFKDFSSFFTELVNNKRNLSSLKDGYIDSPPEVIVYVTGLSGVAYQINQWIPVLERLDCRVAILIRKSGIAKGMLSTRIPIYYARTHREVEWILVNGPKTVLYPANTAQNVQALREYQLNHFFINHGESDKAVNQSKLLMAYDKLLVGGPLAERRLKEVGLPLRDNQVVHVGRPQAELLLTKSYVKSKHIKKILYAPTWEGFVENVNYSSVSDLGISLLNELHSLDGVEILFKPHPFTGKVKEENRRYLQIIKNLCDDAGIKVLNDKDSLHEAMNWSDLLITDISSVLNEYLVTGKPIVLCNAKEYEVGVLNDDFPSSRAAYVLNKGEDILPLLKSIEGEDKLYSARMYVKRDSLGDDSESAMTRFSNVVYESLSS